jgi:glycosyltransferase involved in cell wall biosynthesis
MNSAVTVISRPTKVAQACHTAEHNAVKHHKPVSSMSKTTNHVCRVAHLIYSRKVGGSEMVAAGVCSNLDRSRFDPVVLFMNKSSGTMPDILASLSVPHLGLEMTRFSFLLRPLKVAHILNRLKVDVLHVHHIPLYRRVALGARLSRVKGVVVTEHAKYSISRSGRLQHASRLAARNAAYFTTVSADLKNYFVSEVGIPADSIKVVINGVDTKRFRPAQGDSPLRTLLPVSCKGHVVVSVGRLAEAKDHVTLLRAIKILVLRNIDLCLALIGEGELRELVENAVRELGLQAHVCLLGNRPTVNELLPHADLFVLSSRREGLPMALLEALACGLPVVTTAVGGIPDVVKHGVNGFLVSPENPQSLAEAIERLLGQPETASRMRVANRQKALTEHSMEETAATYAQLYDHIMYGTR